MERSLSPSPDGSDLRESRLSHTLRRIRTRIRDVLGRTAGAPAIPPAIVPHGAHSKVPWVGSLAALTSNRGAGRGEPQLDGVGWKVEVGDGAHERWTEHAEAHPEPFHRAPIELFAGESGSSDVEDHDVGLHPFGIDLDTREPGHAPGQRTGPLVILR